MRSAVSAALDRFLELQSGVEWTNSLCKQGEGFKFAHVHQKLGETGTIQLGDCFHSAQKARIGYLQLCSPLKQPFANSTPFL